MSYLDRIREANIGHQADFVPFTVAGQTVGRIRNDLVDLVLGYERVFTRGDRAVTLTPEFDTPHASPKMRSDAVATVTRDLHARGRISGWREESYGVRQRYRDQPLLLIERAALPLFGIRGWGAHVNGYVIRDGQAHMWIARRASDKPTWPGLLDQIVAGGQPASLNATANVIKECQEEAGMPESLARRAVSTGAVSYIMDAGDGLRPDVALTFDLALPPDFVPVNQDGEVDTFYLWPLDEVAERVRTSTDFKFNCALVVIDFLLRHGHIGPEEPDYLELVTGLRTGLAIDSGR